MTLREDLTLGLALRACRAALARRPAGLLTDLDGTISPIVLNPSHAAVLPGCRVALAAFAQQLDIVAVLSGRRPEDVRAIVQLDGVEYYGVHGLARWTPEGTVVHPQAAAFVESIRVVQRELRRRLAMPGVAFELKGPCLAIHYRQAPAPDAAQTAILNAARELADVHGLAIAEGRMVVELRPPLPLGKGTVVEEVARAHSLAGLVYLGDDRTDMDAFLAVRAWRESGPGRRGVAIVVASSETPRAVVDAADYALSDVPAVEHLLTQLARPSTAGSPPS